MTLTRQMMFWGATLAVVIVALWLLSGSTLREAASGAIALAAGALLFWIGRVRTRGPTGNAVAPPSRPVV